MEKTEYSIISRDLTIITGLAMMLREKIQPSDDNYEADILLAALVNAACRTESQFKKRNAKKLVEA